MRRSGATKLLTSFCAVLMLLQSCAAAYRLEYDPQGAPEAGDAAAEVTVYDSEGEAVTLPSFPGEPTILYFWASYDGEAKEGLALLDAAYHALGGEIVFAAVDLTDGYRDTPDTAAAHFDACGYELPLYHDLEGSAAARYCPDGSLPQTYAVSADGTVTAHLSGAVSEKNLTECLKTLGSGSEEHEG